MKYLLSLFVCLMLYGSGCIQQEQDAIILPSTDEIGGQFAILLRTDSDGVLDLGSIQNTASFPFLLSNEGNRAIWDITLENSDPRFVITYLPVDTLSPGADLRSSRIIVVAATHGTNASGIGIAPTMNPGANYDTIVFRGMTLDGNNREKEIQFQRVLKVNALVADIRLFDDTTEIDLTSPTVSSTGTGITTEEILGYSLSQPEARVLNSGNVPLDITVYLGLTRIQEHIIQPNESDTVRIGTYVVIDTKGTVTISGRLHIASDGKCYFSL